MATELENLVPEVDVEVEGMRGPKGDKGDSYVLTEADKEEIAQKVENNLYVAETLYINNWEQGTLTAASGSKSDSTTRIRTVNFVQFVSEDDITITVPTGYKIGGRVYSKASHNTNYFVEGLQFSAGQITFEPNSEYYYKFLLAKEDDATIVPADVSTDTIHYNLTSLTDITLTQSGKSADAKATGDGILSNSAKLSKIANFNVVGKNLYNKNDTENQKSGVYIAYNTGVISTNKNFVSELIPIEGGTVISSTNLTGGHVCFFDIENSDLASMSVGTTLSGYISGIVGQLTNYPVPSNAKQMSISFPSTRMGTVQVEYGATATEYEPYKVTPAILTGEIISDSGLTDAKITEIAVKVDGSGDYANLREALNVISTAGDASKTNQYVIKLYPGTHDIISMYESENDLPSSGLFLPPYTKIIGVGDKHNVIISGERETVSTTWSALNFRNYAYVENLTITSKNARYTIHDDWQTATDIESNRHFKDVIFKGKNCQYGSVYGSGLKGNSKWEFINCEFDASQAAANGKAGNALSLHNNVNVTTPSFVRFKNCRILNGSESYKTLRFLSMPSGSENGTVTVTLEGCKVDGIRLSENDASQYGAGCSFWVNGFGNVNPLGVSVVSTDGVDYSGRVDLIV